MHYQSIFKAGSFNGKTVIITGGGSGIGRCTAHELASLGAKVILLGRNRDKLDTVLGELHQDGYQAYAYALDIRDEPAVINTVAQILAELGPVHALVNNAGGQFPSPLEHISANGFKAVLDTNLTGGFLLARELFKSCFKVRGGVIVNITADFHNGMPLMAHSGAARAGMANLTQSAAWEWGPYGVRSNNVAPGWVASSGLDSYDEKFQQKLRQIQKQVPLQRLATEAEISAAICFLLSDAAAFINGITLRVDGGSSLASPAAIAPLRQQPDAQQQVFNGFHRAVSPLCLEERGLEERALQEKNLEERSPQEEDLQEQQHHD
ncbi:SDR family oxidoreductase [Thalassomonas viridans]|uniref:Peroxisomal trans-2-enoyl-CoA reductase n=1 Tax=Thalassomonas viridans TaxID=137584 RepID=A0AAE9Z918_9GAMM|nr:SDR family oxidoreductase [Thalassomonas viridans]WDE07538.1 SDR family oxidoreductase [Thalassomonas viridans]